MRGETAVPVPPSRCTPASPAQHEESSIRSLVIRMSFALTSAPVGSGLDSQAPLLALALSVVLCWVAVCLLVAVFGCRHPTSKVLIPAGTLLTLSATAITCCAGW